MPCCAVPSDLLGRGVFRLKLLCQVSSKNALLSAVEPSFPFRAPKTQGTLTFSANRTHVSFHAVPLCAAHDLSVLCGLCWRSAVAMLERKQSPLDRPASPYMQTPALCRHRSCWQQHRPSGLPELSQEPCQAFAEAPCPAQASRQQCSSISRGPRQSSWPPPHSQLSSRPLIAAGITAAVEQHRPKAVFLTSPNNPDGSLIAEADLLAVLQLPVLVVLDEAYIEFAEEPSRMDWVQRHDNLVVLRTFSKSAALAGIRVSGVVYGTSLVTGMSVAAGVL